MQVPFIGDGIDPLRATAGAAGADLFAAEDVVIGPGERALVPTGIRLAIPPGHVGLVWPRSGLAVRHGLDTMAGVIDSDYRGEVLVLLVNHGAAPCRIERGARVAQLLVQKVESANFTRVATLPESERGEGGFGSSGT